LLLNSYAKAVGFKDGDQPFNVSAPPKKSDNDVKEFMGFSYQPVELEEISNPTDTTCTNYDSLKMVTKKHRLKMTMTKSLKDIGNNQSFFQIWLVIMRT
jgi:hypothetical protein